MKSVKAIGLEKLFDTMMATLGCQRVDNYIGRSPDFNNADYIHAQKNLVIELKVIEKDFFKYGGVIDRFQFIIHRPLIPVPGWKPGDPGLYSFSIPPPNREGKHDEFEEPIRRTLKKANRQLRETKEKLMNGTGHGIVILTFVMETMLDIGLLYSLVDQLSPEFSHITGFLIFSPYYAITNADISAMHGIRHSAPQEVKKFINELGDYSWQYFHNASREGLFSL